MEKRLDRDFHYRFFERLENVSGKITQEALSNAIYDHTGHAYSQGKISQMKSGKADIQLIFLYDAAKTFHCSTDYLMGFSDEMNIQKTKKKDYFHDMTIYDFLRVVDGLVDGGIVDVVDIDSQLLEKVFSKNLNSEKKYNTRYCFNNSQSKKYYGVAILPFDLDYSFLDDKVSVLANSLKHYAVIKSLGNRDEEKSIFSGWLNGVDDFKKNLYSFQDDTVLYVESLNKYLYWDFENHAYCDRDTHVLYSGSKENGFERQMSLSLDGKAIYYCNDGFMRDSDNNIYVLNNDKTGYILSIRGSADAVQ